MITHPLKTEELAIYRELLEIVEILTKWYQKTQDKAVLAQIQRVYQTAEEYKQIIDGRCYPHVRTATLDFHR